MADVVRGEEEVVTSSKRLHLVIEHLKKARHVCGICATYDDVECLANGPRLKVAIEHLQEANRILNQIHENITAESN